MAPFNWENGMYMKCLVNHRGLRMGAELFTRIVKESGGDLDKVIARCAKFGFKNTAGNFEDIVSAEWESLRWRGGQE